MIELLLSFVVLTHPIKVLIIDTGSAKLPSIASNTPFFQRWSVSHEHGTMITYLVINGAGPDAKKISKDVVVEICDVDGGVNKSNTYSECLTKMVSGEYDFVNISLNGGIYSEMEELSIKRASWNSRIVVAAGNHKLNIDQTKTYPAEYKNGGYVVAVSALDPNGLLSSYSNYGKDVRFYRGIANAQTVGGFFTETQGTSIAAALYTHKLILQLEKERRKFERQ